MTALAETFQGHISGDLESGAKQSSVAAAYGAIEGLFPGVDVGRIVSEVRESLSALFSDTLLRSGSPEELVITVISGLGAVAGVCLGIGLYSLFHPRRGSCVELSAWGVMGGIVGYTAGGVLGLSLIKGGELSN